MQFWSLIILPIFALAAQAARAQETTEPPPPECCSAQQMAMIGITPEQITFAFGWGFGAIVFGWFLGFVIGAAVDAIRKA